MFQDLRYKIINKLWNQEIYRYHQKEIIKSSWDPDRTATDKDNSQIIIQLIVGDALFLSLMAVVAVMVAVEAILSQILMVTLT